MVVGEFVWVSVLFLVLRLEKGLRRHLLQSGLIFPVEMLMMCIVFSSQPTTHLKCNCCRAGLSFVTAKTDPFLFKPLFILEVVFHISQDHVACWYVHVGGCGFFTPETNANFLYATFLRTKKGQTNKCCLKTIHTYAISSGAFKWESSRHNVFLQVHYYMPS